MEQIQISEKHKATIPFTLSHIPLPSCPSYTSFISLSLLTSVTLRDIPPSYGLHIRATCSPSTCSSIMTQISSREMIPASHPCIGPSYIGIKICIHQLFEKGAEIHTKDNKGCTAHDMATDKAMELKSLGAWNMERGFMEDGSKRKKLLSNVSVLIDCDPRGTDVGDTSSYIHHPHDFPLYVFMTLTILPWYTGMILAMAEFFRNASCKTFYVSCFLRVSSCRLRSSLVFC